MQLLNFSCSTAKFTLGDKTLIMGVLNVTPDSFSDGGRYNETETAVRRGLEMARNGADIIDIGGESTRPGADPVSTTEEKKRILPVIKQLADKTDKLISVDTYKPEVAAAAVNSGAAIINDVTGMRDPEMMKVLKYNNAGFIMMHMRGTPKTMQSQTDYQNLIEDITQYFRERLQNITNADIDPERIVLDPGIGFSKTAEQNLEILAHLEDFRNLQRPVLAGTSRKSFISAVLGEKDPDRIRWGTAGSVAAAITNGADIIRVHDVYEMRDTAAVADTIRQRMIH